MNIYSFVSPEIIFGPGTANQCGQCAVRLGARKVLIVTDDNMIQTGLLDQILLCLKEAGLSYVVWSGVLPNPRDKDVLAGVAYYQQNNCDAVLAFGGGSPIDAAKAVALLASNGGNLGDYEEIDSISRPLPPMLAIPTTAGSGSEVSQFAMIVKDDEKRKMTLVSKSLIPNTTIYDPNFLSTLNNKFMVYSGFNVLSHAVEAFVSVASTPMTDLYALDAVRTASNALRQIYLGIRDKCIHRCIAEANLKAGLAFSNSILGAVHAITHQVCALYDLPAGLVDAVILPRVMEFNLNEARYKYGVIAKNMGQDVRHYALEAEKVLQAVYNLVKEVELPSRLSDLGIDRNMLPLIADNVVKDVCLLTNPREVSFDDVMNILGKAY